MKVGYIRVSSVDQNTDRQLDGIELEKVFEEKVSGKSMDREQLKLCIDFLRDGDVLYVHSIDRLARSLKDLLNIISTLNEKGVAVKFITENQEYNSKSDPTSILMLSMLGAFAQFERNMIKARQVEGIRKAKERGQRFGRKPLSRQKVNEVLNRKAKGQRVVEIANSLNIGTSTVYKVLNQNKLSK